MEEYKSFREVRGRGTGDIRRGRFEKIQVSYLLEEARQIKTQVFKDTSRTIISYNDSPDVGFSASLNPYRGCEHGCLYCYARPTHEYLGLSLGLDFETKLFAKMDAAELLQQEFDKKKWQPQVIVMSGVTDCYQPIEKKLELTRACLEVAARYKNPVVIITKNHLVTRDIDILKELNRYQAIKVCISITSLDKKLATQLEPRASQPKRRLLAIEQLSGAGIPLCVNVAPIIPGLNDHEIPQILKRAKEAGAKEAFYTMVRLPYGVKDIFSQWLERYFPDRKDKVIHRIQEVRGGQLNVSTFGDRMIGVGPYAEHIAQMFNRYRKLYQLDQKIILSIKHFKRESREQLSLFE